VQTTSALALVYKINRNHSTVWRAERITPIQINSNKSADQVMHQATEVCRVNETVSPNFVARVAAAD